MKTITASIKKTVVMLVSFSFLLTSCIPESSVDVNQDRIYTDYEQFYEENTDKTTVVARFRFGGFGGTLLELDSTAFVTFNGDQLPYNFFYGGHVLEYTGRLEPGTFSYTNLDGLTFMNSVPTMDTISFPAEFDTVYKSQANEMGWIGNPLVEDEYVGLFLGSWTWGDDALSVQDADASTSLIISSLQLSDVPLGPLTAFLDRANETEVAQGTDVGGLIRSKYRAEIKTIQVVN